MDKLDSIQEQVNKAVGLMPWCDCDVIPSRMGNFTIACSENLTYFHTIELTFIDVLHVHCRYDFHVDPKKGFFVIRDKGELPAVADESSSLEGYREFVIEDEDSKIHTIIAKKVNVSFDNVLRYFKANLSEGQRLANWVTPPQ
jgi:hypothetical protein